MEERPVGVHDSDLLAALDAGWGIGSGAATYLPVGFGSFHWSVRDDGGAEWFVTVDDLGADEAAREAAFAALGRALATALALRRNADLAFVVAPEPARAGAAVRRLDSRYAVSVYRMVEGDPGHWGPHRVEEIPELVGMLAELHRATPVAGRLAGRTELALPGRATLHAALGTLDREWTGGPYAEPTRRLLAGRADHVERLLGEFDRLVDRVAGGGADWVVTHGEPHPGNLIRTPAGLRLVDWETTLIAPPERDLWMLARDAEDALDRYAAATGRRADPAAIALYGLWWDLADIVSFVEELRRPHEDGADIAAAWRHLNGYLG
ncbi:phosphotransferase family protein [Plantactinospora siamensis]|uniref:Phosphotransferase family protein n=1 Tax=Plantactinospora siamensis TaxID=555372 RepID=A0ABV6NY62_9ACTN